MTQSPRRAKRDGYVLVVTLVLIVIATVLLAGLARYSLRTALISQQTEEQLQLKWGQASIERVTLSNPESILSQPIVLDEGVVAERQQLSVRDGEITLGGTQFEIRVGDEQAKMNVNLWDVNRTDVELKRLLREFACRDSAVQLSPIESVTQDSNSTRYQSFGQLIDSQAIANPSLAAASTRETTQYLTCWGEGGRINLHSALDEALVETASLAIGRGEAEKLVELRNANPSLQKSEVLDRMQLRYDQREKLDSLLVDKSRAWSVWIRAVKRERETDRFVVKEQIGSSSHRVFVFTW